MKKIIVSLLVSLVCFLGYAQTPYPTPNPFGSKGTMTNAQGGWKIDSTAIMPVYADTFAANRSKTSLYAGSLIRVGDDYYYRSADTSKWLLLAITTSNCAGTQLISGSITWSGSGLVYDATDLDYYILCSRYFANSTTLTLSTADPTYGRIDKFYADNTQNIGVITGTPSANPQEPSVNPLTQIDLGFVYIPAGSTVPAGTTQTVIYNENVEWTGTSDVPSINFAYATNPYIGSLSTYLPSAPNSSYVEWQSNGIDYLFSEAQYLKFWVRLNDNFVSDPLSFLDVTFEYTDVTVSQTLAVGNGDYNMDYSLINQWQLVSIPLTGITTFGTDFNSVHFVINSAPTSFQLDYVYLLETATIPPVISSGWSLNLNTGTNPTTNGIGTSDSVGVAIKTNSQTRLIFPANGIVELSNDELDQQLLTIRNDTIYKTNIPTAYGTLPIVVEVRNDSTFITCPTCDTTGGSGWSLTGNAGTTAGTNFIGTTDGAKLMFKVHNTQSGIIDHVSNNNVFGYQSFLSNTSGSSNNAIGSRSLQSNTIGAFNNAMGHFSLYTNTSGALNTAIGNGAMYFNTTGSNNNAVGYQSLFANTTGIENNGLGGSAIRNNTTGDMNTAMGDSALITLTTGSRNTAIGANADVATSSTDSSGAFGFKAVSSTRKMAFSPYFNTMFLNLDSASGTAPAIAGIDENGNWRKYATPAGGSSQWTDTTSGIYYADKVGIGGVINPDSTLVVSGSARITGDLLVGLNNSSTGTGNVVLGVNHTIGTGGYNLVSGAGNVVSNNQGANIVFGEMHVFGDAESSTIINGAYNTVGDGAHDALVGGTGSSSYSRSTIAIGLANSTTAEESISIGGGGNAANGIYSGTFAGTAHEAKDSAAVAIGGQNNSVGGVNAAILGGENNFTSGRNTVVLGGSGINGTMANTTYVDSFRVRGKIVAPGLSTSGTYSKSLAIDASGNIYKKDTLAVSGVYATLTGSETLTNKTITSPTLSGTLIGSGIINTSGNITGFNITATGLIRSAAASNIEHYTRNKFNAASDGFETLTANSGAANTANLSVGSLRTGYVAKTANYTATAFDETISCSTNAFTITLPTAVGCAGQKYNITNSTAANTIGISTTSSQTFANVVATPTSINLVGLGAVTVVSDGANWLQLH